MAAPALAGLRARLEGTDCVETTLLELVWAINQVTHDEREVVATIASLLESGRVRLCGNFRGKKLGIR